MYTLIIPHCPPNGGAGIYNHNLIEFLQIHSSLYANEAYAQDYGVVNTQKFIGKYPSIFLIPLYEGVSILAIAKYIILSFFILPYVIVWILINKKTIENFDRVIFTSSNDLLKIYLMKILGVKIISVCFIQEHLKLNGIKGKFVKFLIKNPNILFSITNSFAKNLRGIGLNCEIARNPFSYQQDLNPISDRDIDILFVGGDQRIKGFSFFLDLVELVAKKKNIKVCILGNVSINNKNKITKLNKNLQITGSEIHLFGFVKDTDIFYLRSKVLLLPIIQPHFCRPAVEAGFQQCPFIINDLDNLDDFVVRSFNCVVAKNNDILDWEKKIIHLLENKSSRQKIALNNYNFVISNFSKDYFQKSLHQIFNT